MTNYQFDKKWKELLKQDLLSPYVTELVSFLDNEHASQTIFPPKDLIFNAFNLTPYEKVKVVIMGQDPYHGPGQAHGLSFSVPQGIPLPPSLKNIYKELNADLGLPIPNHGCLTSWAEQGVLLLNATLTVRKGEPLSHHGRGWERLTDAVIAKLCEREDPMIFVLWGKSAQEKCGSIESHPRHIVLKAPHPSPFSAYQGFFGCRHFSKINDHLLKLGKEPINWSIN